MQELNLDHTAATGCEQYEVFSYFSDLSCASTHFPPNIQLQDNKNIFKQYGHTFQTILIQIGDTLSFLDGQVMIQTKEAHQAGTLQSNRRGWKSYVGRFSILIIQCLVFARKSTFMSYTVTSEWITKYSELLSDCQLATEGSGREMERTSIDEIFFRLSHRISHTGRSEDHPI